MVMNFSHSNLQLYIFKKTYNKSGTHAKCSKQKKKRHCIHRTFKSDFISTWLWFLLIVEPGLWPSASVSRCLLISSQRQVEAWCDLFMCPIQVLSLLQTNRVSCFPCVFMFVLSLENIHWCVITKVLSMSVFLRFYQFFFWFFFHLFICSFFLSYITLR